MAQTNQVAASRPRGSQESGLLLGLVIACLVISIPIGLFDRWLAIGALVVDTCLLVLAIVLLVRASRSSSAHRGRYIAAVVVSALAVVVVALQLVIYPLVNRGIDDAACRLQTVVDRNECPADYELQPGQTLKDSPDPRSLSPVE